MGFKEALQEDLDNVFFDPEEFAGEHTIDGEVVTIIKQDMSFINAKKSGSGSRAGFNTKGLAANNNNVVVFIREEEVKKLKRKRFTANSMINLDGKKYFVSEVKTEGGITKLTMSITMV